MSNGNQQQNAAVPKSMRKLVTDASVPQPQQSGGSHPLSKAMSKRPSPSNQVSESWADEQIQSLSQRHRHVNQTEHQRRREDIEKTLKAAEGQISTMTDLLKKREDLLKETQEDAEQRIEDETGTLNENGIDPVTGLPNPPNEEHKKGEVTKKFTKKRVQNLREKLREMNKKTESYLADIENTMQYLESLEDASDRAGPYSDETRKIFGFKDTEEDAITKIYNESQAVFIKSKTTGKDKSKVSEGHDSEDNEEDESDSDSEHEDKNNQGQFFLTEQERDNTNTNADTEKEKSADGRESAQNTADEQG